MTASPNPACAFTAFSAPLAGQLTLYNAAGKAVRSFAHPGVQRAISISLADLPPGVYLGRLEYGSTVTSCRLLVVH